MKDNFIIQNNAQKKLSAILLVTIFIGWLIVYFTGLSQVPFHPDEATQIFMSADVDNIFSGKTYELYFDNNNQDSQVQKYHLLDAPFTRYWIGLSRWLTNSPPQTRDWDWTKNWSQNKLALPEPELLFTARLSIAIFLPISVILFFLMILKLFNFPVAITGTSLLMFNSIILLHTRRAMAEGPLLFFLILSVFLLLTLPNKKMFLTSISIALAFNTKQSLLPLVLIAFIFIMIENKDTFRSCLLQIISFSIIFLSIFVLLNPVIWRNPILATTAMWQERARLTHNQVEVISDESEFFILKTPIQRVTGLVGQLLVISPAVADVGNYQEAQQNDEREYFANPINIGFGRNLNVAMASLVFIIIGIWASVRGKSRNKIFLFLIFLAFIAETLIAFQIPFQRYYILLFPFSCLYLANGLFYVLVKIKSYLFPKEKVAVNL